MVAVRRDAQKLFNPGDVVTIKNSDGHRLHVMAEVPSGYGLHVRVAWFNKNLDLQKAELPAAMLDLLIASDGMDVSKMSTEELKAEAKKLLEQGERESE